MTSDFIDNFKKPDALIEKLKAAKLQPEEPKDEAKPKKKKNKKQKKRKATEDTVMSNTAANEK